MFSTADIAKRLGCTVQAVNKYRRKIEQRDGVTLGQPDPTDARRVVFTDSELVSITALAPKVPVTEASEGELIEGELIDGEDTEATISPSTSSLSLRHSTLPAVQRNRFDLAAAQDTLTAINTHAARTASRADSLLSEIAQTEMQAAVSDIRQTIATLKANAIGDAVGLLGKPPADAAA